MKRFEIFRDTKDWYLNNKNYVSPNLINFALKNAGKEILDLGCATGDYCSNLEGLGFKCTGIDINPEYVEKARERGVDAYLMKGDNLKFKDNSFDTVLLFEVLEHIENYNNVLNEAKRVAKKNILITVPNCTRFLELKNSNLTYDHMLEKDHIHFFTKKGLENLISKEFENYSIEEKEPIQINKILIAAGVSKWFLWPILLMTKIKKINSLLYYRLYAIIEVE